MLAAARALTGPTAVANFRVTMHTGIALLGLLLIRPTS
jgi:hypothetical protein